MGKQSDLGLRCERSSLIWVYTVCLSVCIFWTRYSMVEPHSSNFKLITIIFWGSEFLGAYGNLFLISGLICPFVKL